MSADIQDGGIGSKEKRYRSLTRNRDYTMDQDWTSYSVSEHDRWNRLYNRLRVILNDRPCDEFIAMMHMLKLSESGIPNMERLGDRLEKVGWAGCAGCRNRSRP